MTGDRRSIAAVHCADLNELEPVELQGGVDVAVMNMVGGTQALRLLFPIF